MRKNILQPEVQREVLERIERLHPDLQPRWGKMTAHQMLLHLVDSCLMALNKRPVKNLSNFITRSIVKWVVLRGSRMPKNVGTAAELDQKKKGTPPKEWEQDKQLLVGLINEFCATPERAELGFHPLFGKLTRQEWARLAFLHTDHHLQQFGV